MVCVWTELSFASSGCGLQVLLQNFAPSLFTGQNNFSGHVFFLVVVCGPLVLAASSFSAHRPGSAYLWVLHSRQLFAEIFPGVMGLKHWDNFFPLRTRQGVYEESASTPSNFFSRRAEGYFSWRTG
jgi:hypothetical protein